MEDKNQGCDRVETKLEHINSQLSELNNWLVDISLKTTAFNDRAQGAIPREANEKSPTCGEDSLINAIYETIGYLRSSISSIDAEVSRPNEIG